MDMLSLIDELDNLVQHAIHVPGGKALVDDAAVREIIEQMRQAAPDEVRQGQRIASERERILADARAQAHRMVEEAQNQISSRLDDQSVVQAARERARVIVAEAEQQAISLATQTNQYALAQLNALENRLQRLLREVQAGERYLAQANSAPEGNNSGGGPNIGSAAPGDTKSTR
jgi:vacuolar-type H+-ATPase subunit H